MAFNKPIKTSTLPENGVGLIEVSGSLTGGEETDHLRQAITGFADRGYGKLIINLGGVEYVNSSGIGTLVSGHTTFTKKGGQVKLTGLNNNIKNIFVITKLTMVFDVYDSVQEAAKSFS